MSKKIEKEIILEEGKLNEVIIRTSVRPNGTRRVIQDFSNCVSATSQLGAHSNDPNYLVNRYKPDELSLYLKSRESMRHAIIGHDFSIEPDAQEARNEVYRLKQGFLDLPEKVQKEFDRDFVKFMKFIDDPRTTAEQLKDLGLLSFKERTAPPEQPQPPAGKDKKADHKDSE